MLNVARVEGENSGGAAMVTTMFPRVLAPVKGSKGPASPRRTNLTRADVLLFQMALSAVVDPMRLESESSVNGNVPSSPPPCGPGGEKGERAEANNVTRVEPEKG